MSRSRVRAVLDGELVAFDENGKPDFPLSASACCTGIRQSPTSLTTCRRRAIRFGYRPAEDRLEIRFGDLFQVCRVNSERLEASRRGRPNQAISKKSATQSPIA
jgi:hypothetical protein